MPTLNRTFHETVLTPELVTLPDSYQIRDILGIQFEWKYLEHKDITPESTWIEYFQYVAIDYTLDLRQTLTVAKFICDTANQGKTLGKIYLRPIQYAMRFELTISANNLWLCTIVDSDKTKRYDSEHAIETIAIIHSLMKWKTEGKWQPS